jgi:hypothetical protein
LSTPVYGRIFVILQKIFNDKLKQEGVTPDRATERAGQICYLPNRGAYYQYHVQLDGGPLDPSRWDAETQVEQERLRSAEEEVRRRHERARTKARRQIESGLESPMDAYNQSYDLPLVLDSYGYIQRGNRWLSPNSETGSPGVTITKDGRKWLSTHGSDADIGMPTANGTMGDAFDLFVHYEHGGDRDAAIKAVARIIEIGREQQQQRHDQVRESADDGLRASPPDDWPEPVNIFDDLCLGDPKWKHNYCPEVVSDFAFDEADRMGVRPEQVAGPALIAASGSIDDRFLVQPKRKDHTWRESARLWGVVVGDSGSMKTPAKQRVDRMLTDIEAGYYQDFKARMDIYEAAARVYDTLPTKVKAETPPPTQPVQPRLVCKQATV